MKLSQGLFDSGGMFTVPAKPCLGLCRLSVTTLSMHRYESLIVTASGIASKRAMPVVTRADRAWNV